MILMWISRKDLAWRVLRPIRRRCLKTQVNCPRSIKLKLLKISSMIIKGKKKNKNAIRMR